MVRAEEFQTEKVQEVQHLDTHKGLTTFVDCDGHQLSLNDNK